ncbi:hypothetical protein FGO68_gene6292 [Halteria grandinella]|uniref:Uncharacterized protein n=1 Tax=Halteria grandinella TaxID=5974 RepID=A0A8J8T6V0_HALGN|nr:hypothetical protein FGO68_gene6292 [Halteria grandinella]
MKVVDRMQRLQTDLDLTQQELQDLTSQGGVSLLPQTEEDILSVKKLTLKHPDKVMQRLNFIMAEFNFILDIFDFKKVDPKYADIVQSHIEQMIDIASSQNLIQIGSQESFQPSPAKPSQLNPLSKKGVKSPNQKPQNEKKTEPQKEQKVYQVEDFEDYPNAYTIDDGDELGTEQEMSSGQVPNRIHINSSADMQIYQNDLNHQQQMFFSQGIAHGASDMDQYYYDEEEQSSPGIMSNQHQY